MGDRASSRRRHVIAIVLAVPLTVVPAAVALAAWNASGVGSAAGAAAVMPSGATPSGGAAGTSVTVSWTAATYADGVPVAGYMVKRFDASSGTPATVGAGCSGVITTTSCTEASVPAGQWVYTDTPVTGSWTGGASAMSAAIVVS
jgi:hypothetical protein